MNNKARLFARDDSLFGDDSEPSGPPPMANFVVTILFFIGIASCCAAAFILLRRRRRASRAILPSYRQPSHQRQLTITTNGDFSKSPSLQVYEEKGSAASRSSPSGNVPELRITFPDEEGDKEKGGRVVIVRVSDSGSVGMAPLLSQDNLPPYQSSDSERFQSLDLNRMGGLKEKEQGQRWS